MPNNVCAFPSKHEDMSMHELGKETQHTNERDLVTLSYNITPLSFVFTLSKNIPYIMNEELPPCVSFTLGYFAFTGEKLQSLCN